MHRNFSQYNAVTHILSQLLSATDGVTGYLSRSITSNPSRTSHSSLATVQKAAYPIPMHLRTMPVDQLSDLYSPPPHIAAHPS